MSCSCSTDLRSKLRGRPGRVIGFVTSVAETDRHWHGHDVVFVHERPWRRRHGRTYLVCACEPGHTRVGGSTAVIYGGDHRILDELGKVPDPIVLAVLYPDDADDLAALVLDLEQAAGTRELHIRFFGVGGSVRVDPFSPAPRLLDIPGGWPRP